MCQLISAAAKVIIVNKPARKAPDVITYADDKILKSQIFAAIERGERIAVCSSQKASSIIALAEALRQRNFGASGRKCNVVCLTAKSSAEEKAKYTGKDMKANFATVDVFIYSPTLTAGVSYEEAHFIALYCIFSRKSASVFDAAQMVSRIRNYDKMHVAFKGHYYQCDNYESLREYLRSLCKRRDVFTCIPTSHIAEVGFCFDEDSPEFQMWLYILRRDRFMRNRFDETFLYFMQKRGSNISKYEAPANDIVVDVGAEIVEAQKQIEQCQYEAVANAPLKCQSEVEYILMKKDKMSEDERNMVRKNVLVNIYGCEVKEAAHVKVADDRTNKKIFLHRKQYARELAKVPDKNDKRIRLDCLLSSYDVVKDRGDTKQLHLARLFLQEKRENVVDVIYLLRLFEFHMPFDPNFKMKIDADKMKEIQARFISPQTLEDKEFEHNFCMRWNAGRTFRGAEKTIGLTKVLQSAFKSLGFVLERKNGKGAYQLYDESFILFDGNNGLPSMKDTIDHLCKDDTII